MSREVFKSINSAHINKRKREMNKTITIDKENVVYKDIHQQSSKGTIPKVFPVKGILKNSKSPNDLDSNIPSSSASSSVLLSSSRDHKEVKHLRFKPDNTYSLTQFAVYDEDTEKNSRTSNSEAESIENESETLFSKSRNFFIHQERAAIRCIPEITSPVAKRALARKSSGELFKKAKETFVIQEEAEKVRKHIESMLMKKSSPVDNITAAKYRRIEELRIENSDLYQDSTPYDANNIPPPRETIKILHKNGSVDSIVRPETALPAYSFSEVNSLSYNTDIMNFFVEKEKSRRQFNPNFRRRNTTVAQRELLIGHLVKIIKDHNYSSFIAYQSARLMDDMLDARLIPIEKLQLVELTSMWIVMKNLLLAYALPEATKIISFSDSAYTIEDLYRCERDIMQTLKFEISYPDPFSVLNYSLFAHPNAMFLPEDSGYIYYTGTYMLDIALFDEYLMSISPVLLGCAAAEMALVINLALHEAFTNPSNNRWRTSFTKTHFKAEEILHAQQLILRHITQSGYRDSPEHAVYKKYKRSRYGRISQLLILTVTRIIPSSIP